MSIWFCFILGWRGYNKVWSRIGRSRGRDDSAVSAEWNAEINRGQVVIVSLVIGSVGSYPVEDDGIDCHLICHREKSV
jgi:hypothetical protein